MNKNLEYYIEMIEAKKTKLNTMAKKMKLMVTRSYNGYNFIDAKRNSFFGHADDLDSAIAFLEHRFPQLAR